MDSISNIALPHCETVYPSSFFLCLIQPRLFSLPQLTTTAALLPARLQPQDFSREISLNVHSYTLPPWALVTHRPRLKWQWATAWPAPKWLTDLLVSPKIVLADHGVLWNTLKSMPVDKPQWTRADKRTMTPVDWCAQLSWIQIIWDHAGS